MLKRFTKPKNTDREEISDKWLIAALISGIIMIIVSSDARYMDFTKEGDLTLRIYFFTYFAAFIITSFNFFMVCCSLKIPKEAMADWHYIKFLRERKAIIPFFFPRYACYQFFYKIWFVLMFVSGIIFPQMHFTEYYLFFDGFIAINMLIMIIGDIGRHYYMRKALKLGCPGLAEYMSDNKAEKTFNLIMLAVYAIGLAIILPDFL